MPATIHGYSGTVTSSSSLTISETSGAPQAGDIRYLFINCNSTITITPPSGWTTLFNAVVGSGTLGVFSKAWVAGVGTETVTYSGATQNGVELVSVAGVDTGTAPVVATNGSTTAGTTLTSASVTPPTSSGLLLVYYAGNTSSGGTTATLTNPTGLVDGEQHPGIAAASYVVRISSLALSSTAATGTFTATASVSTASFRSASLVVPGTTSGAPTGTMNFAPYLGLGTGVSR